jgi:hypothetical protein
MVPEEETAVAPPEKPVPVCDSYVMNKKPLRFFLFAFLTVQIILIGCLTTPSAPTPTRTTPESPAPAATETPRAEAIAPWYLLRGGPKLDQGWGVDVDAAGNIYFAVFQQDAGEPFADMMIYKFSPDGTEIWRTRWGGKLMEKAFIITVAEPYAYVGGLTYSSAIDLNAADMAVLALSTEDGGVAWEFTWGQGYGYEEVDGLVVDGEKIYISGWTTGKTTGNDLAVLKLDLQGNLVWANTWGGDKWDQADGQLVVDNDTLYVCGRYNGENYLLGGEALIVRFSKETGRYLSHAVWGGPIGTDALGMAGDGTYLYTVGLTVDRGNGGQTFLLKWDKNLNLIWERLWGGKGSEEARAVAVGPSGDVYIAGASDSYSNGGAKDIVFLRYNPEGDLIWQRTFGGLQNEAAHGIALYGGYAYIAGNTQSIGAGQDDAILISAGAEEGIFPVFP